MDKPRAAPRKGNKPSKNKRRNSTSSESHEVQDLRGSDDGDEAAERDEDKSEHIEERPFSSKKGSRSRNPSDRDSSQPQQPGSSETSVRPSSSSGRRSRLRSRQRDETFSVEDDDDLHTSDFKRQLDRLERDLTRRDRELEEEREENERCMDRVKKLERDKVELKRENEGLRDEAEEYKRTLEDYKDRVTRSKKTQGPQYAEGSDLSEEDIANHNTFQTSYELSLMQKNKEIERLIEDNETSEEEKQALQAQLTPLKDSLADATTQIESMAHDHFNLKSKIQKSEERIRQLEEENAVVTIREAELKDFKERHDRYMDNLTTAVDQRIAGWKRMMFDKDEEIDRLNMKITALMTQIPNTLMDSERTTIQQLNKKLMDREQHIVLLNEQLSQATEEIESNLRVIENMQSRVILCEDAEKTEKFVRSLQSKLQKSEERLERKCKQLESSEREAEDKSKELTSLMSRMHAYEAGEYGLPEAVSEIKDLKHQIRIRDGQIETLTQDINLLQMQVADYHDENDMIRDKLGIDEHEDISKDAKRYAKNRKNELYAMRSKVSKLEEELVQLKSRNYSLKKQVNEFDALTSHGISTHQQHHDGPEKDFNRSKGGSVSSSKPGSHTQIGLSNPAEMFLKGMTGLGMKGDEWKDKYETIVEENTALRRGLHEILDCMQKMSDDGSSDVMIQAPVLEELLREMSARGIINYPFPITSFHMKVCNLEGKCSQLREELHRLRQEEKECRNDLIEAQLNVKSLQEQVGLRGPDEGGNVHQPRPDSRPRRPQKSRSPSSRIPKKVSFDPNKAQYEDESESPLERRRSSLTSTGIPNALSSTGRNLVLEDLQQEIDYLRSQNEILKEKFNQEKTSLEASVQGIINKANELLKSEDNSDVQLKLEYLQAIRDNQANEITSLIQKLAELENENSGRVGHLERFKMKALHQLSVFQQVLETSVPIHLLYSAKKEIRTLSDELSKLQNKEETYAMKAVAYHKNAEELSDLRAEREKLELELSTCQARLIETAAKLEAVQEESDSKGSPGQVFPSDKIVPPPPSPTPQRESDGYDAAQKLNHTVKMNSLLKSQVNELESSRRELEHQVAEFREKYFESQKFEQDLIEKTQNAISKEQFETAVSKLVSTEESLIVTKDEMLKWKEIAEMTQNQIQAIENIKDFERMEHEVLLKDVVDLQANSVEKSLLAKARMQLLSADKEKHLAIQQVQKLLSRLAQLEAYSLQQEKIHQEREMQLLSMHTQVIMRYRSIFSTQHEMYSNKHRGTKSSANLQSKDLKEAFEMFEKGLKKCSELEEQVLEEKLKVEELEQKCETLESALHAVKDGTGQEMVFDSIQKIQEARVEVSRWKRKAEQVERDCASLKDSVSRLESKASDLEEQRIRLEHTLEMKDSMTSTLMAKSIDAISVTPFETLSTTSMPVLTTSSTKFITIHPRKDSQDCEVQTEEVTRGPSSNDLSQENEALQKTLAELRVNVAELEVILKAKEEIINEMTVLKSQQERESQRSPLEADLKDALVVARETVTSLQDRMKAKEDSLNQYRKLLSDVRSEMTNATDRHVQEMKALQMTIHQQQQAFTRMKSTLSQPVRDIANVEGTIKDQLTRINELEDEVNELQHAMSNTASQLTAARSEAHRWRCVAEARIKEVDSARDQSNVETLEEMNSLRLELRELHKKLEDSQQQISNLKSAGTGRDTMTDLVNALRTELEEKDRQIDAYFKSLHELKNSSKHSEKGFLEEQLASKEKELESLQEIIKEHTRTIAGLNVKVSKSKAINYKTGASAELEELRFKHRDLLDEKAKLEKDLSEFQARRDEEEQKRTKTAESVARWEESKNWKKKVEKLESRIKELEQEANKTQRSLQSRVISITRLEKEKMALEAKLNNRGQQGIRGSSLSAADRFSGSSSLSLQSPQDAEILAKGEIARLNCNIKDLQELVEKTEFEGKEEAEKLKMEVTLLKERIVMQERQLAAYQIAQKGGTQAVSEIESMAARESQLQKDIRRLEEDNLHLNLQIEQLRLDTPRLRDRVQHLQRLVEALKAEKPMIPQQSATGKASSQKSLSELEKTINALKSVIDKLQTENKRLKSKPTSASASSERLKSGMDELLDEKKALLDKVHSLEHETEKLKKRLFEASSKVESLQAMHLDAERRAQSSEMKLRTFLGEYSSATHATPQPPRASSSRSGEDLNLSPGSSYDTLLMKMRSMQEELDNKGRLLKEAKQSLKAAKLVTAPPHTDPVKGGGEIPSFPRHVPTIPESLFEADA